jgi:hypothetical protein
MRFNPIGAAVLAIGSLATLRSTSIIPALAQPAQPAARVEPGLTLKCEVFCSEAARRPSSARIRWTLSRAARTAANITTLAGARQTLEVTVFKDGFQQGLYATLPIAAVSPDRPPIAAAAAQAAQTQLRAYQIRMISVEQPRTTPPADGDTEMSAVVENLEPGVNYTWRIAIDTAGGRLLSASTRCKAPVCPSDSDETPPVRRRGR